MPRYDHAELRASGLNISKFASHYHQLWSWNACEWIIFSIGFDAGLRLSRMPHRNHAELSASGLNISLSNTISFGAGLTIFTISFEAGLRLSRMSCRDHAELWATWLNISLPITISFGAGMHVSKIICTIGFVAGVRLTIFFIPSAIKSNSEWSEFLYHVFGWILLLGI